MSTLTKRTKKVEDMLKIAYGDEVELVDGYTKAESKATFVHTTCGTTKTMTAGSLLRPNAKFFCKTCKISIESSEEHNQGSLKSPKYTKMNTDEFRAKLKYIRGTEYIVPDGEEYMGALEKIKITHISCGYSWDVRATHILHTSSCPVCTMSERSILVFKMIKLLNYKVKVGYKFEDCVYKNMLPFDFALLDSNENIVGLVEYDGKQHYEPSGMKNGIKKFKETQRNDKIKDRYCKEEKIPLLRVNYMQSDKEIEDEIKFFLEGK